MSVTKKINMLIFKAYFDKKIEVIENFQEELMSFLT